MDSTKDTLFTARSLQRRRQSLPANIHSSLGIHLLQERFAKASPAEELSPRPDTQLGTKKVEQETITKISSDIADLIKKYRRTGSAFVSKRSWYRPNISSGENGLQTPSYGYLRTRRGSLDPPDHKPLSPGQRGRSGARPPPLLSLSPRLKNHKDTPRTSLGGVHQGKKVNDGDHKENSGNEDSGNRSRRGAASWSPTGKRKPVVVLVEPPEEDHDSGSGDRSRSPSPDPLEMSRLRGRRHTVMGIPELPRGILKLTPRSSSNQKPPSVWEQTLEECSKKFVDNAQENIPDGSDVYQAVLEDLKQKKNGKTVQEMHASTNMNLYPGDVRVEHNARQENKLGVIPSNKIVNPALSSARPRKVKFQ